VRGSVDLIRSSPDKETPAAENINENNTKPRNSTPRGEKKAFGWSNR